MPTDAELRARVANWREMIALRRHRNPVYYEGLEDAANELESLLRPQESERCEVPPAGWRCTRAPNHDGPCAAVQVEPEHAARERLMLSARIDELQAIKASGIIHPLQEMVDNRIEQLRAALKMARWGEASDAAERNRT